MVEEHWFKMFNKIVKRIVFTYPAFTKSTTWFFALPKYRLCKHPSLG